ncbi:MAG: family 78 glycoside hydrolase catalytic domain [Oscillospiraceae bacterium]|nr:family 78 glycoside hydrolase catalytic domain [Oscillospiraceae bacterium]
MNEIKKKGVCWIKADDCCQSPVICHSFQAEQPSSAYLEITGLGYFAVTVNGRKITGDRFVPAQSDYEKRDLSDLLYPISDTFTHRIYYLRYDCSRAMKSGENTIEIRLGNGFYRQTERTIEGSMAYGQDLKTAFCLAFEDQTGHREIFSDGTELWRQSEILSNNLFTGEVHDARILAQEPVWKPVQTVAPPQAELTLQTCPADRVIRKLTPVLLREDGCRRIYDAGENISGTVRVTTGAPAGTKIRLRFAENYTDGELDLKSTGAFDYDCTSGCKQIMEDIFICDGNARSFEPLFVWHAFRYFEVVGPVDSVEVLVIHSDTPVTSTFESDSEGMNWLYQAFVRTQLNNMHGGVPSDCPHRERLGYTGDGQVCAEAAMLTLQSREFYRKWIRDILDCQDVLGGHVQHTAPFMGGGGGPGGWGCAIVLVPYAYYRRYGEAQMLEQCYEPMKKWCSYLDSRLENRLVSREEPGGWCLGDWCTLEKTVLPEPFVNTYFYIKCLQILQKIAAILDKPGQIGAFAAKENALKLALTQAYFDEKTGNFFDNVQGANAYGLDIGLGDERTLSNLVSHYEKLGHFDTGFLGTDILLNVLFQKEQKELAVKLLSSREPGSFLYMKDRGTTTLWETWTGNESHDHPMFGACVRQLFTGVLGIGQAEDTAGYQNLIICPQIPQNMQYARGSIQTANGKISVSWRKEQGNVHMDIQIPEGTAGVFRYGAKEWTLQAGKPFQTVLLQEERIGI